LDLARNEGRDAGAGPADLDEVDLGDINTGVLQRRFGKRLAGGTRPLGTNLLADQISGSSDIRRRKEDVVG